MPAHTITVTLTLRGPVISGSTEPGRQGLDLAGHRTDDGRLAVPGSLMKGRVAEAWDDLSRLDPAFSRPPDTWLGAPSYSALTTGLLDFGDDWTLDGGVAASRIRIAVDPERGAAETHMMQTLEQPWAVGELVALRGTVRFIADSHTAASVHTQLTQGLQWLPAVGALEGIGFGEVVSVETALASDAAQAAGVALPVDPVPGSDRLDLVLEFDRAICFATRQPIGNLFTSADIVPGAAVKAAVLRAIKDHGLAVPTLVAHIDTLRFEHAVPVKAGQSHRPGVLPLSLAATAGDGDSVRLSDVALTGPCLIGNEAPAFAIDWKGKHHEAADALRQWQAPLRKLRSRHRHDAGARRAADGEFFAYERVTKEGFLWHSSLDVGAMEPVTRRSVVAELATVLAHGLTHLGKTKARARGALHPVLPPPPEFESRTTPRDGVWVVVLNSPALLCDPSLLHGANSAADLRRAYATAWSEISGQTVVLKEYLTTQSLAGGEFLWKRFRPNSPYEPYLLTDAGSVFVLAPAAGGAPPVSTWLRDGLPLPAWAVTRYGAAWNQCPYLPQNGYGAVSVNMPLHWNRRPVGADLTTLSPLGGKE